MLYQQWKVQNWKELNETQFWETFHQRGIVKKKRQHYSFKPLSPPSLLSSKIIIKEISIANQLISFKYKYIPNYLGVILNSFLLLLISFSLLIPILSIYKIAAVILGLFFLWHNHHNQISYWENTLHEYLIGTKPN